jgi:Icc-related predicted phosphoesterase
MKILTVSDVVDASLYPGYDADRFAGVDLVLACGDLPPEYLSFLVNALNVPLYFVRGNHDIRYETKPPIGAGSVHSKLIQFKGIKIMGFEGSHWYNGGPNQYTEWQMRFIVYRMLPTIWRRGGIDIFLTHAPPRFVHDAEDPCHRGFLVFRWLIRHCRPQYFIHGHIHKCFNDDSERITLIESTRVVNTYGFFQIEIDDRPRARQA